MAVCAHYRVPHSVFLDWGQSDRDKAIWWLIREREACPSCGTRKAEWDEAQGGDRNAYIARKMRCRGCEVREQAEASIDREQDGKGVHVELQRRKT